MRGHRDSAEARIVSLIFPRWANAVPGAIAAALGLFGATAVATVWYYFTPNYWEVGYRPDQPVDYSHQLHAGKLGIDCRYCHYNVEESYRSSVPDTATCMSCHTGEGEQGFLNFDLWRAHKGNANLVTLRAAFASGEPVRWKRIHKLPDYVQFPHAAHVNAGVSCYSCHGNINELVVVEQREPLSMGWCLECHRNPEKALIDVDGLLGDGAVKVTDLARVAKLLDSNEQRARGAKLAEQKQLEPPEHCGACHY
jgi:hypothetical protein